MFLIVLVRVFGLATCLLVVCGCLGFDVLLELLCFRLFSCGLKLLRFWIFCCFIVLIILWGFH